MSQGPYKRDGKTVYATAPNIESSDGGDSEGPLHQDKEWLHYQYHILGKSTPEMADIADVAPSTICRNMKKMDVPLRDMGEAVSKAQGCDTKLWNEDWLREQYCSREKSIYKIADDCGTHHSTVHRALDRFGIEPRSRSESSKIQHERGYGDEKYNNLGWLVHQYVVLGKSAGEIGRENGWSHKTVLNALEKNEIPTRSPRAAKLVQFKREKGTAPSERRELVTSAGIDASWRDIGDVTRGKYVPYRDPNWLQSLVSNGLTAQEIAERCDCEVSKATILNWIGRLNIKTGGNEHF